jgi:hypothetical protein
MEYTKNTVVESTTIYAVPSSDRFIMVQRVNDKVIGLNYMQGCCVEELDYFKKHYCEVDLPLTMYYQSIYTLLKDDDEIENIDHAIWVYINYQNNLEDLNDEQ